MIRPGGMLLDTNGDGIAQTLRHLPVSRQIFEIVIGDRPRGALEKLCQAAYRDRKVQRLSAQSA